MSQPKTRTDEERTSAAGKGGDIIFMAGNGGVDDEGLRATDGNIIFQLADGTEFLRLDHSGDAFVRGTLVATDGEVYSAMNAWLAAARVRAEPGAIFTPHEEPEPELSCDPDDFPLY